MLQDLTFVVALERIRLDRATILVEGKFNHGGAAQDYAAVRKSLAGLVDLVLRGEIERDSTVLYAHLGGQPALNAYSALFR